MNFSLYALASPHITLDELKAINAKSVGDLLARAENSGSEGIYCEVVRWSYTNHRWERYAFHKFFDGDIGDHTALACAQLCADEINKAATADQSLSPIFHTMPEWSNEKRASGS